MHKVRVYSAPHCKACDFVKDYLREQGIEYDETDVSTDKDACEKLLKLTGRMQLPTTEFAGIYVIGFSRRRIDALLEACGVTAT